MNGPTTYEAPMPNGGGDNPLYELAMYDLAQELAYAEQKNDTAAVKEISDVLLDKLLDEENKRIANRSEERPPDKSPTDWNNHISDTLWDEVIYSPEKRKAKQPAQPRPSRADYQRLGAALAATKEKKMQEPLPIAVASYSISQPRRQPEGRPPLINGDTVLKNDSLMFYGVFDGVSGGPGTLAENAARAAQASRAAAEAIKDEYESSDNPFQTKEDIMGYLKALVISAREGVRQHGGGGATTATFFKIVKIDNQPYLAGSHIGDTRMLIQREPRGPIAQLTKDQSQWTPKGSMLRNALSSEEPPGIHTLDEFIIEPLPPGSRVVLCSDGITGDKEDQRLTDEEMHEAFNQPTPAEAAQTFLTLSKKNDDKSVVVVDINELPAEQKPMPKAVVTPPLPNNYEKKKKRRRLAAVIGAAAVLGAATAVLLANNLSNDHPKQPKLTNPPVSQKQPSRPTRPTKPKTTPKPPEHERRAIKTIQERLARPGTTIWGQSAIFLQKNDYLTHNPTINNIIIDSVKDDVLVYQDKSETAAKDLPVGYTFTIPRFSLVKARQLKKQLTHQN